MATGYQWLIESRASSQRLLADLHAFIRDNRVALSAKERDPQWSILALLVGAAFSLWRAAFLSFDADRDPANIVDNAEQFLRKVIEDNAINYPQDRATAAWSSGYYLNGARYRVAAVLGKFAHAGLPVDRPEYARFRELHERGIRTGGPDVLWNELSDVVVCAFEDIKSDWAKSAPKGKRRGRGKRLPRGE